MDTIRRSRLFAAVLFAGLWLTPQGGLAAIDAWPLLEIDEDTTTVFYPFYVKEHDFMMVFPFYYRTAEGRDHHVLWPLLKVSEGELERLAPFYFRPHEDQFTLFPLIHQDANATWWMIPPIYVSRKSDFQAVFPLYLHADHTTWLLPNLRLEFDENIERVTSAGIFDWKRTRNATELNALLIASFGWRSDASATHARVFPLFAIRRDALGQNTWIGPVNYAKRGDLTRICVLPLYCDKRKGDERQRFIGPWYESKTKSSKSGGVLGLYGTRSEIARDGSRSEQLSLLAWAYDRRVKRDAEGEILERSRRFLIFTDRRTPETQSMGLLGLPIWERTRRKGSGTQATSRATSP